MTSTKSKMKVFFTSTVNIKLTSIVGIKLILDIDIYLTIQLDVNLMLPNLIDVHKIKTRTITFLLLFGLERNIYDQHFSEQYTIKYNT